MSVNSTSPAMLFGGTWERLKDKFLLGAGDTYTAGATGGRADTVLPLHNHAIWVPGKSFTAARSDTTQSGTSSLTKLTASTTYTSESSDREKNEPPYIVGYKNGDLMATPMGANDYSQTNLPPYLAVNIWKRTA